MKNIIVIGLFLGVLVNCSKSKDGGGIPGAGLPALTDTQRQKVASVNSSIADIAVITEDKNTTATGGSTLPMKVARKELTKTQEELAQKMDWAETYSYCISNAQVSGAQDGMSASLINFEIAGSQCPISYVSKVKTTPVVSESSYSMTVEQNDKFFVNPQGVLNLGLDITAYTTSAKATMNFSGNQSVLNISMNMSEKMNATSTQYGNVNTDLSARMNVSMNVDSNGSITSQNHSLSMTISQTYADFKVVAYMVSSGSVNSGMQVTDNSTYYINGQQVPAEEFFSLIGEVEMSPEVSSLIR